MSLALKSPPAELPSLVPHYSQVETPRHENGKKLFDYWGAVVAREGSFRIGRDIPARPIAALLRNISINEPMGDGKDMRVRLAGSGMRRRFGREVAGSRLSKLFPSPAFEYHRDIGLGVLSSGKPHIVDCSLKRERIEELHSEILLLPIVDRDGESPLLLVGSFYFG